MTKKTPLRGGEWRKPPPRQRKPQNFRLRRYFNLFSPKMGKKTPCQENCHIYDEKKYFTPGKKACLTNLPWGKIGMTVCYDLRFPHLYRKLAKNGAFFISVPSAFTKFTGEKHWHILLRARAIETGCFIFAPAQFGNHPGKKQTYGHLSLIHI